MSITDLILRENYVEAKSIITEHMNQLALGILDEVKVHYAKHLFTEEIDAKFKGKTDMDFVKDAKAEAGDGEEAENDDDVPEPDDDEPEDNEDDDDNNKTVKSKSGNVTVNIKEGNITEVSKKLLGRYIRAASDDRNALGYVSGRTDSDHADKKDDKRAKGIYKATQKLVDNVTIKEGIVPAAKGKPSKDQPGGGAAENPAWKGKQKALMAKGPNKEKGKTTAITEVSESIDVSKGMNAFTKSLRKIKKTVSDDKPTQKKPMNTTSLTNALRKIKKSVSKD